MVGPYLGHVVKTRPIRADKVLSKKCPFHLRTGYNSSLGNSMVEFKFQNVQPFGPQAISATGYCPPLRILPTPILGLRLGLRLTLGLE